MKIAVICANGKAGKLIVSEALMRGHEVTAVVRGENKSAAPKAVIKDIMSLTGEDLKGFDVIINAFGVWTEDLLPQFSTTQAHLLSILAGSESRLIIVGGAGSLYMDKTHTVRLVDTEGFPEAYKPLSTAMGRALNEIRECKNVKWTVISPAADFRADGPRTGEYILAGEEFTVNEKGESVMSYADYAIAMLDEAEKGGHIQERISVIGK